MARLLPIGMLGCFALWLVYRRLSLYIKHRKFQQTHQCSPAPALPQYDRVFGIDLMLENFKSWKAGRFLDRLQSRFDRAGNTYSATVAGDRITYTMEPENIKAIFADKFDDFDTGWSK